MFKNYLITAWRNIVSHKLYAVINIAGLGIAFAATILIALFVRYETSFDTWLAEADSIYRLETTNLVPGQPPERLPRSMGLAKEALEKDFSSISEATRIYFSRPNIRRDDVLFAEIVAFVDPNFFSVFDLPMVAGDRSQALANNTSIILSQSAAFKYFGEQDPINQILVLNGEESYQVVGVMQNLPDNSHLDFEFIALFDVERYQDRPYIANTWRSTFVYTYLKVENALEASRIQAALPDFISRNRPETEAAVSLNPIQFDLVPIQDIHLQSPGGYGMTPTISSKVIYIYSTIAIFILLIASANYVNLATARAIQRAREIGLRKVLGGSRGQLITQFIIESSLFSVMAFGLGLLAVQLVLPWYNAELGKSLVINPLEDGLLFIEFFGILTFVTLISGLYPALYLSSIRPTRALNSGRGSSKSNTVLGNFLVLGQFAISITLIIITIGVFSQTRFAQSFETGFEENGVVVIQGMRRLDVQPKISQLVDRLKNIPGVENASLSLFVPTDDGDFRVPVTGNDQSAASQTFFSALPVDENFFQTFGIDAEQGRLFSENFSTDKLNLESQQDLVGNVILNRQAVQQLGLSNPQDALGKSITLALVEGPVLMTIVGIVPNFNLQSVHHEIKPTAYFVDPTRFSKLSLKLSRNAPAETMKEISLVWSSIYPDVTLRATFLEDMIAEQYQDEKSQMQTFIVFALLAVVLACFGLYGLASFTAAARTKEIGIRKIMGASSLDMIRLMVWKFSKPVALANLIAWPVAWYFFNDWLSGFAFRVEISLFYFGAAGLLTLLVAWATVAGNAWKVARANPIKALRYE